MSPAPNFIPLDVGNILTAISEAKRRNDLRKYQFGCSKWKRGLTGSIHVDGVGEIAAEIAPIVAGLLGEFACASFINRRLKRNACDVDFRLLSIGDNDVDLCPFGLKIQVKTRTRDYGKHLVRVANPNGTPVTLNADAFVFAEWNRSDAVRLYGWCWKKDFRGMPVSKGKADQFNVEVFNEVTYPMTRLIDELKSRM